VRQIQANDLLKKLDQDHLEDPAVQAYFAPWRASFDWGIAQAACHIWASWASFAII